VVLISQNDIEKRKKRKRKEERKNVGGGAKTLSHAPPFWEVGLRLPYPPPSGCAPLDLLVRIMPTQIMPSTVIRVQFGFFFNTLLLTILLNFSVQAIFINEKLRKDTKQKP